MSEFDLEERDKRNIDEIANSIKLQWDNPSFDGKILLLVEHETDKRCYYKLFNEDKVEFRTTRGCNRMKHLFDAIQKFDIPNFAIQDSDFSRICNSEPSDDNYFITDFHDHEMMCVSNSKVMKDIFSNLAIKFDQPLVDQVFADLEMLSYFKWYNYRYHLNINFRNYKPRDKSRAELTSISAIFEVVKPHSPKRKKDICEKEVLEFVKEQPEQSAFEITNGHDFLDMLSQRIGQKYEMKSLNGDHIRPIIYTCFTFDQFVKTDLYKNIYKWAGDNASVLFAA